MVSSKTVVMLALTGLVVVLALATSMDIDNRPFTVSEQENFTVDSGEWYEDGGWLENESNSNITVTEDGFLAIDNPARGDVAVWHSKPFFPSANHYLREVYVLTNNVQYNNKNREVTLQYYCLDQEEVIFEKTLADGGQTIPVELDRDSAYEIRLILETDESVSPEVEFLDYTYRSSSLTGFLMSDLVEFYVYFMLVVVVGSFLTSEDS